MMLPSPSVHAVGVSIVGIAVGCSIHIVIGVAVGAISSVGVIVIHSIRTIVGTACCGIVVSGGCLIGVAITSSLLVTPIAEAARQSENADYRYNSAYQK